MCVVSVCQTVHPLICLCLCEIREIINTATKLYHTFTKAFTGKFEIVAYLVNPIQDDTIQDSLQTDIIIWQEELDVFSNTLNVFSKYNMYNSQRELHKYLLVPFKYKNKYIREQFRVDKVNVSSLAEAC